MDLQQKGRAIPLTGIDIERFKNLAESLRGRDVVKPNAIHLVDGDQRLSPSDQANARYRLSTTLEDGMVAFTAPMRNPTPSIKCYTALNGILGKEAVFGTSDTTEVDESIWNTFLDDIQNFVNTFNIATV